MRVMREDARIPDLCFDCSTTAVTVIDFKVLRMRLCRDCQIDLIAKLAHAIQRTEFDDRPRARWEVDPDDDVAPERYYD